MNPTEVPALSPDQQFAKDFLCEYFDDVRVTKTRLYHATWSVRLEGLDADGTVGCKLIVLPDGDISGAWDPESLVASYYTRIPHSPGVIKAPIQLPPGPGDDD
jgi:hypothetical protein